MVLSVKRWRLIVSSDIFFPLISILIFLGENEKQEILEYRAQNLNFHWLIICVPENEKKKRAFLNQIWTIWIILMGKSQNGNHFLMWRRKLTYWFNRKSALMRESHVITSRKRTISLFLFRLSKQFKPNIDQIFYEYSRKSLP